MTTNQDARSRFFDFLGIPDRHRRDPYENHSDWGRSPPTTIDIAKLMRLRPQHAQCGLCVRRSAKNPRFIGLYCQQHGAYLQWVNPYQIEFLRDLGVTDIREDLTT